MSISSEHLEDLHKSGLSNDVISQAKIYSVSPSDIKKKLGWDSVKIESMLAFPYHGNGGFERYKIFPPYKDRDGHMVKYLQPKGTPAHLYIPAQIQNVLQAPSIPLSITEGEKKCLRLIQEGIFCIGIGGLWAWSQDGLLIPDFYKISWQGRTVRFYPDSDVWRREDLLKAVYAFCRELESRGSNIVIVKLPQNGSEKVGLDDYLQAGNTADDLQRLPTTTTEGSEFDGMEGWLTVRKVRRAGSPISELEAMFKGYFNLDDFTAMKVVLATVIANQADGDPVWLLIVGPPSSLKSEFIQSLQGLDCVYPVSLLTPRTFASGDKSTKDSSLLERLADRSILTMKDFGSVLQMRRDDRSEVLAALREIYDGSYTKDFGNGKRVVWDGKLGLIAGVTGVIDEYHSVHHILGERFLLYRLEDFNRTSASKMALKNAGSDKSIRRNIREAVSAFFKTVSPVSNWFLNDEYTDKLVALTDFVTRSRTGVLRDGYSREISYVPEWEGPARFAKQLHRLAYGLSCLNNEVSLSSENYEILFSVAENSIPKIRRDILHFFIGQDDMGDAATIAEALGMPERVVYRTLEDMKVLKLLEHQKPLFFIKEDVKQLLTLASP